MKKIKITEAQAKRLKLISENSDELARFEHYCTLKAEDVNKFYVRISHITIAEILNNEVNMENITSMLNALEREISQASKKAYDYVEQLSDDELYDRVRKAEDKVMDKLTSLQLVTMDLEKVQLLVKEHNLTKPFYDIKSMDITDLQ